MKPPLTVKGVIAALESLKLPNGTIPLLNPKRLRFLTRADAAHQERFPVTTRTEFPK